MVFKNNRKACDYFTGRKRVSLGLIRRGSFTRAVLMGNDLMTGFSCARMLDSLLRLTGAHNVYYVKCNITSRTVPMPEPFPAVLAFRTALVFIHTQ